MILTIRQYFPAFRILGFGTRLGQIEIENAFFAGADGYLDTAADPNLLAEAMRQSGRNVMVDKEPDDADVASVESQPIATLPEPLVQPEPTQAPKPFPPPAPAEVPPPEPILPSEPARLPEPPRLPEPAPPPAPAAPEPPEPTPTKREPTREPRPTPRPEPIPPPQPPPPIPQPEPPPIPEPEPPPIPQPEPPPIPQPEPPPIPQPEPPPIPQPEPRPIPQPEPPPAPVPQPEPQPQPLPQFERPPRPKPREQHLPLPPARRARRPRREKEHLGLMEPSDGSVLLSGIPESAPPPPAANRPPERAGVVAKDSPPASVEPERRQPPTESKVEYIDPDEWTILLQGPSRTKSSRLLDWWGRRKERSEPEIGPKPGPETRPEPKPELKVELKPESRPEARPGRRPEPKPEPRSPEVQTRASDAPPPTRARRPAPPSPIALTEPSARPAPAVPDGPQRKGKHVKEKRSLRPPRLPRRREPTVSEIATPSAPRPPTQPSDEVAAPQPAKPPKVKAAPEPLPLIQEPPPEPVVPEPEPESVIKEPEPEPGPEPEPEPVVEEPEPIQAPEPAVETASELAPLVPTGTDQEFFERSGVGLVVVGIPVSARDWAAKALGVAPEQIRWLSSATAVEAFMADHRDSTFVLLVTPGVKRKDVFGMADYVTRLNPATGTILLGDPTDEAFVLSSLRAGVREVVDPAISGAELAQVLERVLEGSARIRASRGSPIQEAGAGTGTIISVFSTKGGTGKTFLATNLAVALAAQSHADTAVFDLNFALGDAVSYFGAEPPLDLDGLRELADGNEDRIAIRRKGLQVGDHIWAYATQPDSVGQVRPSGETVVSLLRMFRRMFAYTVVDTTREYDEQALAALDLADVVCLVTVLDVVSVRHLSSAYNTLLSLGIPSHRLLVVLNRADSRVQLSASDVQHVLKFHADAHISSSRLVPLSLNRGRPIYLDEPKSTVSKGIGDLAGRIMHLHPQAAEFPPLEPSMETSRLGLFRKL
jgi:Flp pilus assembly CpaE family ATPase